MKPAITTALFTGLFSVLFFTSSFAQQAVEIVAVQKQMSLDCITSIEKETNHACTTKSMDITSLKPVKDVPIKLLRVFYRSFENIDPVWYAYDKKGKTFLAVFYKDGRQSRALFGKGGYMHHAVSNATEKDLPADYNRYIKSNYVDFTINFLAEVTTPDFKTSWVVNLRDAQNHVIVKLSDGGLEELARYEIPNSPVAKKTGQSKKDKTPGITLK